MLSNVRTYRRRISNNPVESYFKHLKHDLLKQIKSTSELTRSLHSDLIAKSEIYLPKPTSNSNSNNNNPTTSVNSQLIERFKKKRNRRTKGYYCKEIGNTDVNGILIEDYETNGNLNDYSKAFSV